MRVFVPNHYSYKNEKKNRRDSSPRTSRPSNQQIPSSSSPTPISNETQDCGRKLASEEINEKLRNSNPIEQQQQLQAQQNQQQSGGHSTSFTSSCSTESLEESRTQKQLLSVKKSSIYQESTSSAPSATGTGSFSLSSNTNLEVVDKKRTSASSSQSLSSKVVDSITQLTSNSGEAIDSQFSQIKRRCPPSISTSPPSILGSAHSSCGEPNLAPILKKLKSDSQHKIQEKHLAHFQEDYKQPPTDKTRESIEHSYTAASTSNHKRSFQKYQQFSENISSAHAMGLGPRETLNHHETMGRGIRSYKSPLQIQLHSQHDEAHGASIIQESITKSSSACSKESDANISRFKEALKKRGLEEIEQEGDGNCLFRAVSLQIYGDSDSHMDVRRRCMDFMGKDVAHFSQFVVDESFQEYTARKRQDGVHGNNPEIQAISELYNRPVEVFVPENGASPINIFQSEYKTGDAPIRLSYHDGNHYNAVIDPLLPTAGLGLGLPGLEPGLADKLQMQKAVDESDQIFIQKATEEASNMELKSAIEESKKLSAKESSTGFDYMYEKKKALVFSDLEETNYEMEQAILLSSLESFQRSEASRKQSGRRGRGISPQQNCDNIGLSSNRNSEGRSFLSSDPSTNVASLSAVASSSTAAIANQHEDEIPAHVMRQDSDEYPQTVQELVMNGFELSKVLKAYDLIGDNFDDLLAFLMGSGN